MLFFIIYGHTVDSRVGCLWKSLLMLGKVDLNYPILLGHITLGNGLKEKQDVV
jgi:hypothetical protein